MSALSELKRLRMRAAKPLRDLTDEEKQHPLVLIAWATAFREGVDESIQIVEEESDGAD